MRDRLFRRRIFQHCFIMGLALLLMKLITVSGADRNWDHLYYDLWHRFSGKRASELHTVIVAIDNPTLARHPEEPLVFWGPHFAKVINTIRKADAKIIGLDFLFMVGAESWMKRFDLSESDKSRFYDAPLRSQLIQGNIVLSGFLAEAEQGGIKKIMPVFDYWGLLPGGQKDVGIVNLYPDPDGVVRSFLPCFSLTGGMETGFGALLAAKSAMLNPDDGPWRFGGSPPFDPTLPRRIGYAGPPTTIPRVSFQRLLEADGAEAELRAALKDKVVIIAEENTGSQDIHQTPYSRKWLGWTGQMMLGGEIHANIVETLLSGDYPLDPPPLGKWLYLFFWCTVSSALFLSVNPLRGGLEGALAMCIPPFLSFFAFDRWNVFFPVAPAQFMVGCCYLLSLGTRLTSSERKREQLKTIFGRYVSDDLVNILIQEDRQPDLGGELAEITVLFSDIRNFTSIAEKLTAHEVVEMLNAYLGDVCDAIWKQGGMIDKFIGDAVMAIFNAPVVYDDHAARALRASVEMRHVAEKFRGWMERRFPDRGLPEFDIGIGIHTGGALVGNIGSAKRIEYTAIGDVVNIASRLESETKKQGWKIIASAVTIAAAGPQARTGGACEVQLKGKEDMVKIFELVGMEE